MNPDEFALKQFQQTENGETGQTEKVILSRQRRPFYPGKKLTNLEELSFLMVLALPKASKAGLAWMI